MFTAVREKVLITGSHLLKTAKEEVQDIYKEVRNIVPHIALKTLAQVGATWALFVYSPGVSLVGFAIGLVFPKQVQEVAQKVKTVFNASSSLLLKTLLLGITGYFAIQAHAYVVPAIAFFFAAQFSSQVYYTCQERVATKVNQAGLNLFAQMAITWPLFELCPGIATLGFACSLIFPKKVQEVVERVDCIYRACDKFWQKFLLFGVGGYLALKGMPYTLPLVAFYHSAKLTTLLYLTCKDKLRREHAPAPAPAPIQ